MLGMPARHLGLGTKEERDMTPQDILTIRKHLWLLQGREDAFARAFFTRLSEIAPDLRPVFPGDAADQGRRLMRALVRAADHLDWPEVAAPGASRHGSVDASFEAVGAALLHTLARTLQGVFDDAAWLVWTAAAPRLSGALAEGLPVAQGHAA